MERLRRRLTATILLEKNRVDAKRIYVETVGVSNDVHHEQWPHANGRSMNTQYGQTSVGISVSGYGSISTNPAERYNAWAACMNAALSSLIVRYPTAGRRELRQLGQVPLDNLIDAAHLSFEYLENSVSFVQFGCGPVYVLGPQGPNRRELFVNVSGDDSRFGSSRSVGPAGITT